MLDNFEVTFTQEFAAEYHRNNKSAVCKNLRCFPHCSTVHKEQGYCGNPVLAEVKVTKQSSILLGDLTFLGQFQPIKDEFVGLSGFISTKTILNISSNNNAEIFVGNCRVIESNHNFERAEVIFESRPWTYNWRSYKTKNSTSHSFVMTVLGPQSDGGKKVLHQHFSPTFLVSSTRRVKKCEEQNRGLDTEDLAQQKIKQPSPPSSTTNTEQVGDWYNDVGTALTECFTLGLVSPEKPKDVERAVVVVPETDLQKLSVAKRKIIVRKHPTARKKSLLATISPEIIELDLAPSVEENINIQVRSNWFPLCIQHSIDIDQKIKYNTENSVMWSNTFLQLCCDDYLAFWLSKTDNMDLIDDAIKHRLIIKKISPRYLLHIKQVLNEIDDLLFKNNLLEENGKEIREYEERHYTYILLSPTLLSYVGLTNNPRRRLSEHKEHFRSCNSRLLFEDNYTNEFDKVMMFVLISSNKRIAKKAEDLLIEFKRKFDLVKLVNKDRKKSKLY